MHALMLTPRVDSEHDVLGFTVQWIGALADQVESLDVLTGYEGVHDLPANVSVRSYGKERGLSKPERLVAFQRQCRQLARTGDINVLFSHMIPKFVLASWPWFGLRGTPYVQWYAHSNVDLSLRLAHRLVDGVVTPTASSFRLPSEKVRVVGHGIDTDWFVPGDQNPDRTTLLNVGRIDPVKNLDVVVDAVDELLDRGRDVSLRVVGEPTADESYATQVRRQVTDLNLADRIEFRGSVPHTEVLAEYQRAGVFINASRTGSLDKTEIEAMATETPVVSCNDSFADMVRDSSVDDAKLTFPPGDANALADRVETLLDLDEAAYRNLGSECREVARARHDVRALMETIADILARVAGEDG